MSQPESETFQHYQVLRRDDGSLFELGRGAMGITYKAFDTNLRCYVALKVVNGLYLNSETARARFLREARAAAALRHRNVASVFHLGQDDQSFFYAMEFVDGETVAALVDKTGPLPVARALGIALQVARALGAAHKQNLVHRDIKPANLMVTREDEDEEEEASEENGHLHVKVIDFGLARSSLDAAGSSSGPITMGGFVGTAQFASPEQLEEREVDIRSDIYSLGITLWYLLAGQPPFTGSMFSLYSQHLTKEPPWEQLGERVPEAVREVLAKMLHKNPPDRYQTPTSLRRALEACLAALPPETGAETIARRLPGEDGETETSRTEGEAATLTAETLVDAAPMAAPPPRATAVPAAVPTKIPPAAPPPSTALTPPAQAGGILGGRFLLVRLVGEGTAGRVYLAQDIPENNRPVALKLAWPGLASGEDVRARLEVEFSKLQTAPHPNLLAVHALGRHGDAPFLALEWINGFTLLDLLRHRGRLPVREALEVLLPVAAAADHARTHGLHDLDLSPRQILVGFPGEPALDPDAAGRHLGTPLTAWPAQSWKVPALSLPVQDSSSHAEGATWTGDMTMVASAARSPSFTAPGAAAGRASITGVALLAYELLDGAPPADALTLGGRYTSLASLNEAGNEVLHRAIIPRSGAPGDGQRTEFPTASAFCEALARGAGFDPVALRGAAGLTAAATATGVRVASRQAPPTLGGASAFTAAPASVAGRGLLTDSPAASAAVAETLRSSTPGTEVRADPPTSAPEPPLEEPAPPRRRSVSPLLIAATLGILLLGGGITFWMMRRSGGDPGPDDVNHHPPLVSPTPSPTATPALTPTSPPPAATPGLAVSTTPTPPPRRVGQQTLRVPEQFPQLQAAFEAAQPGDTIQVGPGSYPGPVVFKEGIRLVGASAANCLITAVEPDAAAGSAANGALLKVSDCRAGSIENLTFQGSGSVGPLGARQDGILLTNSSVTVKDCIVTAMSGSGIVIHDTESRPMITNNRCRLNGEHGLVFERGANGTAEKNTLENNEGNGMIVADRGTNPTLRANESRDNKRHGLNFLRGSSGTAERNTLSANGSSGIAVDSSDTVPTLRGNRCLNNRQHGLGYARGAAGVAEENVLEGNTGNGIFVHGTDTAPTLRGNRALRNRNNGMSFEKAAGGTAEDNVLEANDGCGILISDPITSPELMRNTATKNKKFGVATVNAPQVKLDPSNKLSGNTLGVFTKQ